MADVPQPQVPYGQVVGHFVRFLADSSDVSDVPDEMPLQGSVILTPLTRVIRYPTTTPPRLAVAETVACTLDYNGDLQAPGGGGTDVFVIATDQPAGQPSLVQWQATFKFTNVSAQPAPVVFNVPAGGVVDLAVLVGVPPEPPAIIVVDPDSALEAAAAADAAQAAADAAEAAADEAVAAAADTVKVTTQTFDPGQQTQARTNIAAANAAPVGMSVAPSGADDTAQLIAAITAAAGQEIKLSPGGIYHISGTLPGANINAQGATIEVTANVDAITVTPTSRLVNASVKATAPGYSSTLLKINDKAGFNVLATTRIGNVTLQGVSATTGVAIGADDGGAAGIVTFIKADVIDIRTIGTGIKLANTHLSSWFNGNEFTKVTIYDVANPVVITGICDSNTLRGQIQYAGSTVQGVRCSGNSNILDLMLWDTNAYPTAGTWDLNGGSYNKLTSPLMASQAGTLKGANPSNEVNYVTRNGVVYVRPKDRSQFQTRSGSTLNTLENFLGEQDNFLKMAHKTYTVTSTSGSVIAAFDFSASPVVWAMTAGQSITITVDCTAAPVSALHVLGVLFTFNAWSDTLKIETENSGGTRTTVLDVADFRSPLQHTPGVIAGTVYKIHFTFTSATAKTVRLSRIFGSSGNIEQKTFLTSNGGTSYGPLIMSASYIKHGTYTTAGRPNAATAGAGAQVYDTTLSKPVFSDGTAWRDSAGAAV